jgi:hypothetical protein
MLGGKEMKTTVTTITEKYENGQLIEKRTEIETQENHQSELSHFALAYANVIDNSGTTRTGNVENCSKTTNLKETPLQGKDAINYILDCLKRGVNPDLTKYDTNAGLRAVSYL